MRSPRRTRSKEDRDPAADKHHGQLSLFEEMCLLDVLRDEVDERWLDDDVRPRA